MFAFPLAVLSISTGVALWLPSKVGGLFFRTVVQPSVMPEMTNEEIDVLLKEIFG